MIGLAFGAGWELEGGAALLTLSVLISLLNPCMISLFCSASIMWFVVVVLAATASISSFFCANALTRSDMRCWNSSGDISLSWSFACCIRSSISASFTGDDWAVWYAGSANGFSAYPLASAWWPVACRGCG
jgi:hypothetical protein